MMRRREALLAGTAAAFAGVAPHAASAQSIDQLQMFVPAAPGGGWDTTARMLEQAMKESNLIRTAQITNKGGAGGTVGLPEFVNQWKGRPNAIMIGGMVMVGAIITNKAPVSLTQTVPIARLTEESEVVVVHPQSPFKSLQDMVAAMKADISKVPIAGGSAGGTDHIVAGLIAKANGLDPKRVPYVAFAGGGPAQAAILGNQVAAGVSGYGEFAENIKAGKMRALGVSGEQRIPGVDIPTFREQGVDVALANWRGVFAPPGITDAQRDAMIQLMEATVKSPAWQEILRKQDWTNVLQTGEPFSKYVSAEFVRIEAILKDLGLA